MERPDPALPDYRARTIPWIRVVQFHKEIVARAEQGFFSLNGQEDQAERWSSLAAFNPGDLAGPWRIEQDRILSRSFRVAVEQGQHESLFLGGPCFLGWTEDRSGKHVPQWRPLLYREVELRPESDQLAVMPKQGNWSVTPLLFRLIDRLEVNLALPLDGLAAHLIEAAAALSEREGWSIDRSVFEALFVEVPPARKELSSLPRPTTFPVKPTPWVLFAPTNSSSALTQHLMRDYERMGQLLAADPLNTGGLKLLEERPAPPAKDDSDLLPVVPLNDSQRRAVKRILEQHPLTVISGPPGTGKSQVAVALLLNAWARGQSVLFASNNNKAVDVVRERLERFEAEFPIAVRAGARQRQNIQEVLRRTLNMASEARTNPRIESELKQLRSRQRDLTEEREALQKELESRLPQRLDESLRSALRAYAEHQETLANMQQEEIRLKAETATFGLAERSATEIERAVGETQAWLERMDYFQQLAREDSRRSAQIEAQIGIHRNQRNQALEAAGLDASNVGDWKWLLFGPQPELLEEWHNRFRKLLDKPLEAGLAPISWRAEFDQWLSDGEAEAWASGARSFCVTVIEAFTEIAPLIGSVRELSVAVDEQRAKLALTGLPEDIDLPMEVLRSWAAAFAEYRSWKPGRLAALPWSRSARLRRYLRHLEGEMRRGIPLEVWIGIGVLDDQGRDRLVPVVTTAQRWLELRQEQEQAQVIIDEITEKTRALQAEARLLGLSGVPNDAGLDIWMPVVEQCEMRAATADQAAAAWRFRVRKESVEEQLRTIATEWTWLASGVPVHEAWREKQGCAFDETVRGLGNKPDLEQVVKARRAVYSGDLDHLVHCWRTARDHQVAINELQGDLLAVPGEANRIRQWWDERPQQAIVLNGNPLPGWADLEGPLRLVEGVGNWCRRWQRHIETIRPGQEQKAQEELTRALAKLGQSVEMLPAGSIKERLQKSYEALESNPFQDWSTLELNDAFDAFSPERIRARISGIEAELEMASFEDAKARWRQRLQNDDEATRAVDALEKSLRQSQGRIEEGHYSLFRAALRIVPIWITTAQAAQAIPLEPELFDIVVIDEASQCTLTNLLPLVYRGRTLAVIGDENQLPAIPTIRESEELALARKYEIEEHLALVGHADNDVYQSAAESLPRRRADVLMLREHFRSNPQIIGFSNRHIYFQRLQLKKEPGLSQGLPVGSGVHIRRISGVSQPGPNGRSWVNRPEAEAVLRLIQELKAGDARSLSVGVVTPFAAHKEFLRERLDSLGLTSEVLVDTAYGFQGDERDVMIFSPVVARGIRESASRWVETPPNLINVAITRAREVLFVVGDFDYLRQQQGILRKLALYCQDIQLLRETSVAELELFSWMVINGWEPQVHPRVGDLEVDFVLKAESGLRLAIEVDGQQHAQAVHQDKARDAFLQAQGYKVLRFPARDVMETPFEVVHRIESHVRSQQR